MCSRVSLGEIEFVFIQAAFEPTMLFHKLTAKGKSGQNGKLEYAVTQQTHNNINVNQSRNNTVYITAIGLSSNFQTL